MCRENPGRVANETEPVLCRRNPRIIRNPARPLDTLHNLHAIRCEEVSRTSRMKLAMIGDREKKDLRPPEELLTDTQTRKPTGLVTIRLLSGRYAKDNDEDPDKRKSGYPQFLALTLAHVKAILLSHETWRHVPCLHQEPSLFSWGVDFDHPTIPDDPEDNFQRIGIDYLFEGMSMSGSEFPVISSICAMFGGYVGRCPTERQKILDLLFRSSRDTPGTIKRALESRPSYVQEPCAPHRFRDGGKTLCQGIGRVQDEGNSGRERSSLLVYGTGAQRVVLAEKQRPRSRGKK